MKTYIDPVTKRVPDYWKRRIEKAVADARADDLKRIAELERHLNRANASIKMLVQQSNDAIAKSSELERENADLRSQLAAALGALNALKHSDGCFCEAAFCGPHGEHPRHSPECERAMKALSTRPAPSLETVVEALKEARLAGCHGADPNDCPLCAALDKVHAALGI